MAVEVSGCWTRLQDNDLFQLVIVDWRKSVVGFGRRSPVGPDRLAVKILSHGPSHADICVVVVVGITAWRWVYVMGNFS